MLAPPMALAPAWRRSTSRRVIEAFARDDAPRFAREIRRGYSQRISKRRACAIHPYQQVLWSLHAFGATSRSRAVAELLAEGAAEDTGSHRRRRRRDQKLADALADIEAGHASDGFEQLAWLNLVLFEEGLRDDLFLRAWRRGWEQMQVLLEAPATLAARLSVDQRALLLGELPWLYGLLYAEVRGARRAREAGAARLRAELSRVCDTDGMPHADSLQRLPLCLAPFTRAAAIGALFDRDWCSHRAARRFSKLVVRSAALLQPSGQTALCNGVAHSAGPLLRAAAQLAGLGKAHEASQFVAAVTGETGGRNRKRRRRLACAPRLKRKHRPAAESDAARIACLRNNWGLGADACIIAFDGAAPRIDLTAFGVPLVSGAWELGTSTSGSEWSASDGRWECVCWFSDANADYVELQWDAPGRGLLRQALLSRTDHFLLLCDVAHAEPAAESLQHSLRLPLQAGSRCRQDALTREWELRMEGLRLRVLPLGLPQELIHRADGGLCVDARHIELRQSTSGARLACPLLLDWSPARRKAPAQWRQLTVAESGRVLRPEAALGARWRIGAAQWLYYHALTAGQTARTVLGLHTFHETVVAELDSSGEIEPIVQVEAQSAG